MIESIITFYRKSCFDRHFVKRAKFWHFSQTLLSSRVFFYLSCFFSRAPVMVRTTGEKRRQSWFLSTTSTRSDTFNFHSDTCVQFFVLTHIQKTRFTKNQNDELVLVPLLWTFFWILMSKWLETLRSTKMTRIVASDKNWQLHCYLPWKLFSRSSREPLSLLPLKNKKIWLHGVFKVFSVKSPALVNKIKYYMSSFVSSYPLKGAHGNNDNLQFIVVWLVGWFKKAHRLLKTLIWIFFWPKYTNLVLDFFAKALRGY